ncbi:unnamed protein product [Knipowitschia caucasica]
MNLRSGPVEQNQPSALKKKKTPRETNAAEMASLETSLKTMLTEFKEDIVGQIKEVRGDLEAYATEMKTLREDFNGIRKDLTMAEQRIDELETRERDTNITIEQLQKEQQQMSEKLDYLESKSRQNNIRIYQVKEGLEGNEMTSFILNLLKESLGIPTEEIIINAAHRSLTQRPTSGNAAPRSIIIRFQEWRMRQKVLQAAWSKKEIVVGGNRIFFSQDFSCKIQAERSRYSALRKQLRQKNVKSHIVYPAKLRVFLDGNETIYSSLEDASRNLKKIGLLDQGEPVTQETEAGHAPFKKVR